ncbi:MAG: tetratricopeptide repeat protein [Gammaproteobacteria bacterium]|nr:tetratricopeptide repeat protein [Gammaproteobacteria bacterium]
MCKRFTEHLTLLALVFLMGCQSASTVSMTEDAAGPVVEVDRKSAALFDAALAAIADGKLRDAEVLLNELTVREPALSGPWVNLGLVQNELGNAAGAEASFKSAVTANPSNCVALTELGLLARRNGDFLAAEANYLACLKQVPEFREAHLNLGILYELYLGRLSDALDSYRAYLSLQTDEDRRVAGWAMDLERRLALVAES